MTAPILVWLRRDLRLADQPAFHAAAASGAPMVPVYVLDDDGAGDRALGGASRWWLHHSLTALDVDLRRAGSRLILRRGGAARELAAVAKEAGAREIHAIVHYEPWWRKAEGEVAKVLNLHLHDGNYLAPPASVLTGGGTPFRIFTPFWRALEQEMPPPEPLTRPKLTAPATWPDSARLEDWNLLPTAPDWAGGFRKAWRVGEHSAQDRLDEFLDRVGDYETARNLPSIDGSSRFSPHLHWGELSPRHVWHALSGKRGIGAQSFRRELGWRDFAQGIVAQFPRYGEESFREEHRRLPWRDPRGEAKGDWAAWRQGRTGYPIVDAGMRQLWATGWMHNRVRMIAASFLIKHLLIDWRHGERWFWDTLVDADYGNNAVNWQWVSGSGVDASLFSRIMAPLVQSPKFQAANYIREWVPELAGLSDDDIHDPVFRPTGYPAPIVGHREARERALAAYAQVKSGA
ncbi:deoxyribodipyrimidine photo-lyase [Novosphingobium sp. Gsoil 351]|uniref:cryptochrome/photolyase family protein n=1 Tax=Novosphingobium sp. Gsoil 351 TaxID=2675225 RepID=UPI0012B4F196|nr:deoxyribodipyrimidine photo-lyase [Novosphingobium sp. Gsoil 351]QGN53792.1 deoxyribodipyrimidine photo-lyase [Novosphingobium sp. Gsoil 351]